MARAAASSPTQFHWGTLGRWPHQARGQGWARVMERIQLRGLRRHALADTLGLMRIQVLAPMMERVRRRGLVRSWPLASLVELMTSLLELAPIAPMAQVQLHVGARPLVVPRLRRTALALSWTRLTIQRLVARLIRLWAQFAHVSGL